MVCTRNGTITMGGNELRTGTSRFLVQGAFVFYNMVMAVYFIFWAVYWPRAEGFRKQAVHQLTFWTWDVCTGYFVISTVAALLCWRAMKTNDGPAGGHSSPSRALRREKNGRSAVIGHATPDRLPAQEPSATIMSPTAATVTPRAGAGFRAQNRGEKPPVPCGLRWLHLFLWNVACVGSLVITLVWFTEDYVQQVQEGVKNFDIQAHGFMGLLMLVNQLLVADDFKLKHVVISQVYGVVYLAFSIVWLYNAPEEDKYVYEDILDWETNREQACIWAGVALAIVVPLAGLVHFFLCRLREAIHGRFQNERSATLKRQASSIIRTEGTFDC